ncbi:MAG: DUF2384 domain-containing protein [Betaproteobacteria bacterium]|nr:DUF2384 domain-containing protein [Betaproteobacteria bacterium]
MPIEKTKSSSSRGIKIAAPRAMKAAKRAGQGSGAGSAPQDPVLLALTKSPGAIGRPKDFFAHLYKARPLDRVRTVKSGIVFHVLDVVAHEMGTRPNNLVATLGIGRSTIARKKQRGMRLGKDQSERLMGVATLIGQVQAMVNEQGNQADFDAAKWFQKWAEKPVPALGGQRPDELLDTMEGQQIVGNLLGAIRAGAYL